MCIRDRPKAQDSGDNGTFFDSDINSSNKQLVTVKAVCPTGGLIIKKDQPDEVVELGYNYVPGTVADFEKKDGVVRDWYDQLMRDRTYGLTALQGAADAMSADYVDKGVEEGFTWKRNEENHSLSLIHIWVVLRQLVPLDQICLRLLRGHAAL